MNDESALPGALPNCTRPYRIEARSGIGIGVPALLFIEGEVDPFDAEQCWQVHGLVYATGRWRRRRVGGAIYSARVTRTWAATRIWEIRWATGDRWSVAA
jgi:hypothetical protein